MPSHSYIRKGKRLRPRSGAAGVLPSARNLAPGLPVDRAGPMPPAAPLPPREESVHTPRAHFKRGLLGPGPEARNPNPLPHALASTPSEDWRRTFRWGIEKSRTSTVPALHRGEALKETVGTPEPRRPDGRRSPAGRRPSTRLRTGLVQAGQIRGLQVGGGRRSRAWDRVGRQGRGRRERREGRGSAGQRREREQVSG